MLILAMLILVMLIVVMLRVVILSVIMECRSALRLSDRTKRSSLPPNV
jgi:hypothetical protein